jgi:hypothetical protein
MPRFLIVSDEQQDVAKIATSLLARNAGAAARDSAVAALRRANPGVDLDRLRPGAVLVVPDLPAAADRVPDPVADVLDDLTGRASTAVETLLADLGRSEALRRADAEGTRAILDSDDVRRALQDPTAARNAELLARSLEEDDVTAKQQRTATSRAAKQWLTELTDLRKLGDG